MERVAAAECRRWAEKEKPKRRQQCAGRGLKYRERAAFAGGPCACGLGSPIHWSCLPLPAPPAISASQHDDHAGALGGRPGATLPALYLRCLDAARPCACVFREPLSTAETLSMWDQGNPRPKQWQSCVSLFSAAIDFFMTPSVILLS